MLTKEAIADGLKAVVGDAGILSRPDDVKPYAKDWTYLSGNASFVAFPKNTEEVSKLLKFCNDHKIAVVPSGGRTGLAGGAVANQGEVVISLEKMNKILAIDTVGMSITAEAGAVIQTLQQKAREAGLFYPVDLAAKGSCQLGGNIATNAGGLKLIRFGGTRDHVLGIEVVLPSGEILDLNFNLRKDNSGYDFKQLFIGSEGTLGIITKATMRLVHLPKELKLSCMACESFNDILEIIKICNLRGIQPTAFEFLTRQALEVVLKFHQEVRDPFQEKSNFYALLEVERLSSETDAMLENLMAEVFEKNLAKDAIIADTSAEFRAIWGMRENISESVSQAGQVRKNDVTAPIAKLGEFYEEALKLLKKAPAHIQMILFGHVGDGNIHINYLAPKEVDSAQFSKEVKALETEIFKLIGRLRGSISAEHGIGLIKKEELHVTRTKAQLDLMRAIKKVFDPNGIMNPGKIFD